MKAVSLTIQKLLEMLKFFADKRTNGQTDKRTYRQTKKQTRSIDAKAYIEIPRKKAVTDLYTVEFALLTNPPADFNCLLRSRVSLSSRK